ncbi:hypothetical protein CRG98_036775 [Punica granatum]|uniref:LRAT domain-containing protein n=1 Tax=Punica granatum TaxID=22663 RepID=A0A2I0IG55_PUNGR|nr:hypothetical protein CRG98_036775 [Punica granatum]
MGLLSNRREQEVGKRTFIDFLLGCSVPSPTQVPCTTCTPAEEDHGVVLSCLNCFLSGGILNRFEYSVSRAFFLAKARGGTCTLAVSDPPEFVVARAKYLHENGFGRYNVFKKNCEDFAIYCKTGLFALGNGASGQGGQVASIIGGPLAAAPATLLPLVTTNIYGMAVATVSSVARYCVNRYAADIGSGRRRDVVKVSVENLTRMLQVIEPPPSALRSVS